MKMHRTRRVVIKSADVDVRIVPFVAWLNSFPDVFTRHCCQGDKDEGEPPYCVFYCENSFTLAMVLKELRFYAGVEVEWYDSGGMVRYVVRFHNEQMLRDFIKERT